MQYVHYTAVVGKHTDTGFLQLLSNTIQGLLIHGH